MSTGQIIVDGKQIDYYNRYQKYIAKKIEAERTFHRWEEMLNSAKQILISELVLAKNMNPMEIEGMIDKYISWLKNKKRDSSNSW